MRYPLVRITLAAAMGAGLLLSPKLWLTDRHYPHAPVWDGLPTVPPPADQLLFGGLLLLLSLSAVLPRARWPVLAFVSLAGLWSLWDQTRWQPWFYQYLFMLAALGATGGEHPERRAAVLNACRFVLATTYFWSGVQKFNVSFASELYPWVMSPALQLLPDGLRDWAAARGWEAALLESGLGIGLLVPSLRVVVVPLLLLMHAAVLFCLGPTGHNLNSVIWPWNAALMVLVTLLFAGTPRVTPRDIVWSRGLPLARVTLVLFGVLPLLSFFDCWDPYLSAALYSGNTPHAHIRVGGAAAGRLPPEVRDRYLDGDILDQTSWSMDELNVPRYPARRVYRDIARRLGGSPDVTLEIEDRPHWRTGERPVTREDLDER